VKIVKAVRTVAKAKIPKMIKKVLQAVKASPKKTKIQKTTRVPQKVVQVKKSAIVLLTNVNSP
jgi:predicted transcriptional regulator